MFNNNEDFNNLTSGSHSFQTSSNPLFLGLEFLVLESISIPKVLGPF